MEKIKVHGSKPGTFFYYKKSILDLQEFMEICRIIAR